MFCKLNLNIFNIVFVGVVETMGDCPGDAYNCEVIGGQK